MFHGVYACMDQTPLLHVMAGVLSDPEGRLLLAQRPLGGEHAGLWEFPGGKCEIGESPETALARELAEELDIVLTSVEPLIRVPQAQPTRTLLLDVLRVKAWQGSPRGREGQALAWRLPAEIDPMLMPPADRPVLAALREPTHYWITPPDASEPSQLRGLIVKAVARGAQRLLLRFPALPATAFEPLAMIAAQDCAEAGVELILSAHHAATVALAARLGVGAQLSHALLMDSAQRPPGLCRMGASCHDRLSLEQAERLGCDFATLSPVAPTASHPEAAALGWAGFARRRAFTSLPVYALGGVGPGDLRAAREAGAQGLAGIRGFFPD